MKKLMINSKNKYLHTLMDEEMKEYTLSLDFFDIEDEVQVGNIIYVNEELLNPKYEGFSTSYTFGSLDSQYGKENIQLDDIDVIKLVIDEKEIYLKRLYG